jgi:hypothetical protein
LPRIGFDCQIILDGAGYFLEPGSYAMTRARSASTTNTAGTAKANSGTLSGSTTVSTDGSGNGSSGSLPFAVPFHEIPTITLDAADPDLLGSGSATVTRPSAASFAIEVTGAEADTVVAINWLATPPSASPSDLPASSPPAGGSPTRIVDRGPAMRTWTMTVLCANNLRRYDGSPLGVSGLEIRDALTRSYDKVAAVIGFTDPLGAFFHVRFAAYAETMTDTRTQITGPQLLAKIQLVEAA